MPEISQDAFEALNPGSQPISADELRKRSNSVNKNPIPSVQIDSLIGAESNFWPAMENKQNAIGGRGPRESRVSVGEFDSCYTAPELPKGYKRESSHR